jgi:hypothetical protein
MKKLSVRIIIGTLLIATSGSSVNGAAKNQEKNVLLRLVENNKNGANPIHKNQLSDSELRKLKALCRKRTYYVLAMVTDEKIAKLALVAQKELAESYPLSYSEKYRYDQAHPLLVPVKLFENHLGASMRDISRAIPRFPGIISHYVRVGIVYRHHALARAQLHAEEPPSTYPGYETYLQKKIEQK